MAARRRPSSLTAEDAAAVERLLSELGMSEEAGGDGDGDGAPVASPSPTTTTTTPAVGAGLLTFAPSSAYRRPNVGPEDERLVNSLLSELGLGTRRRQRPRGRHRSSVTDDDDDDDDDEDARDTGHSDVGEDPDADGDDAGDDADDDVATSNGGDRASEDSWTVATDVGTPDECAASTPGGVSLAASASLPAINDLKAAAAPPPPPEPASLLTLPDELLMHIFKRIEVPDQASVAVTCRRLSYLLQDDLWFPRLQEAKLLRRFLDAETEDQRKAAMRLATVVERAQLPWIHVRPSVAQALGYLASNTRLVTLNANHCREVTTDVLPQLNRLRSLRELDLSCNKAITNQDIIFLLSSLRNLETLSLRKCAGITDAALLGLPITGRRLKTLDLRACPNVAGTFLVASPRGRSRRTGPATDDGAAPLADPLTLALESLRLMRLPESLIAGLVALAPALRELTAQDARNITDQACTALATLTSLKCLKMRGCVRITSTGMAALAAGLPRLETLGLRGRRGCQLTALQGLSELRSLRLSWKSDMYDEHLSELVVRFPLLVKLDLTNCVHVTDEGIRIAAARLALVSLKIVDCPLITDAGYAHVLTIRTLEKLSVAWTVTAPPVNAAAMRQAARTARLASGPAVAAPAAAAAPGTFPLGPVPAPAHASSSASPAAAQAGGGSAATAAAAGGGGGVGPASMSATAASLWRRPLELLGNPFGSSGGRHEPAASAASGQLLPPPTASTAPPPTGTLGALASMRQSIVRALSSYDVAHSSSSSAAVPAAAPPAAGPPSPQRAPLTRQPPQPAPQPQPPAHTVPSALAPYTVHPADVNSLLRTGNLRLSLLAGLHAPFAPALRTLRLHHNGPADMLPIHTAVNAIATLASLEDLRLCGWALNDVHAERLARGLPAVRTLILTKSRITAHGVVSIGDGMRRLIYLDLRHGSEVTGEGFGIFRRMNAPLHTLVLSACPKLETSSLRTIAGIQNLHWLDLSLSPVRAADLRDLARSATLRKLVLRACPTLTAASALQALQGARHLHTVDLTGCPLQETPAHRRASAHAAAASRNMLRVHGWGGRAPDDPVQEPFTHARLEALRRPFAKVLLQVVTATGAPVPDAQAVVVDVFV